MWPWLLAVAVAGIAGWRAVRRRERAYALMLLCRRADLDYSPLDPFDDTLWMPFRWLVGGRWVRAEHVVWNRAASDETRAFDLIVEEYGTSQDAPRRRHLTCATAALPFGCPKLEITPRDAISSVGDAVGAADVELELEAFNRRFRVRAHDRRFAVAFCDQRMMSALMALPPHVAVAVNEDRLLLRASELSPPATLLLFEAARAVARAVPPVVADLYPPRPAVGPHEERWMQGHWSSRPIGNDVPPSPAHDGGRV